MKEYELQKIIESTMQAQDSKVATLRFLMTTLPIQAAVNQVEDL